MYSKTGLMALCAAAAVKEVAAAQHMHADKRELVYAATETVVITDYVVVTVTAGQEATAAAATPVSTASKAHRPHHHHHSKQQSSAAAATTESSAPVEVPETSTSVAVPTVIPDTTSVAVPTVIPTTMITAVKPTSVAQDPPVVSSPAEVTPVAEQSTTVVPTSSAIPVATPVAHASSGGKRGLAYNDASLVQEFLTLGGQASWAYNWGSSGGELPQGVTYYPMLWSPAPDHSNGWEQLAQQAIDNGADALLSFNEPDIVSQANMLPADAAEGHKQWMNPWADKARISTPAISSSENAGQGIDWLKQFFNACNGECKFDFCAAHWYGPGGVDGANLFLDHLKAVNEACDGKPVWVTEFAAESDSIDDFMSTIVEKLESEEFNFVEKYSYFMASVGNLFTSPTELTSFGKIYAGL
ncbi:glycosyl hydrolase catalytic core-domain-containing protein [Astrocystis sublimbata]|nr:glycosyl hydrolase catalytic core-domain-containing protein [Astrocystis sublimbata]